MKNSNIKSNTQNHFILYFLVLLSYISIAMPGPILAPLLLEKNLSVFHSHQFNLFMLGLLLASYPFGQLVGSPILGKISDRVNKKWLLMITLLGAAICYLALGFAFYFYSLMIIFIFRFLAGVFESNIVICQSLLATMNNSYFLKIKSFSSFYVMCTLGFVIGPIIGGLCVNQPFYRYFGYSLPFFICFFLSSALLVVVWRYLKLVSGAFYVEEAKICKVTSLTTRECKSVNFYIALSLVCFLGVDAFLSFSSVYLVQKWQFDSRKLMYFAVYLSLLLALSQKFFVPIFLKNIPAKKLLLMTLIMPGFILAFISWLHASLWFFLASVFPICFSISTLTTSLTLIISELTNKNAQGKHFGWLRSSRAFGDTLVCVFSGFLAGYSAAYPILLSAIFFMSAAALLSINLLSKVGDDN